MTWFWHRKKRPDSQVPELARQLTEQADQLQALTEQLTKHVSSSARERKA